MTKNRLKKLRSLIKEAEHLQSEYKDMMCSPKTFVQDSVKDYSTGYPHNIVIQGYGSDDFVALRQKLYNKRKLIIKEIIEMEEWLNSVSDTRIRNILRLQYWDGMTQEEIAEKYDCDVRTIKRWLKNFWENIA